MAKSRDIEALDLQMRFLAKEECFTRRFGLFSEPEFMFRNSGGIENFQHDVQIDLDNEETSCIISSIVADLTGNILPRTKIDEPEKISIVSSAGGRENVKDAVMQACNEIDFHKTIMGTENIQNTTASDAERDHLVPKDEFSWEDEQESIDELWNEMSSGRKDGMKFKDCANLAAHIPCNDDGSRHTPIESKEFSFALSLPSSQTEFKECGDLFSQIYRQNVESKKRNSILFRKGNPLLGGQDVPANCKLNAYETIAEIAFGTCPTDKLDEEGNYLKVFDTQASKSKDIFSSQNYEQDQFEGIKDVARQEGATKKCEIMGEIDDESCSAQPCMSQVMPYSRKVEQEEFESVTGIAFAKSPAETSDMFDEEIDAAIDDYLHSQKQALQFDSQRSCISLAHSEELESAEFCVTKNNVDTQTTIIGPIYSSSSKCDCAEKSSALKRSLKALCLENMFCKKPKTFLLSSPNDCSTSWLPVNEIKEFKEISSAENGSDAPQCLDDLPSSKSSIKNMSEAEEKQSKTLIMNEENCSKNDKIQQDKCEDDVEPHDHEASSVEIGALPSVPPANFRWENDTQTPMGNDTDNTGDGDTPSKWKTPRRLRLGLSKRFKPQLPLHQTLQPCGTKRGL